MSRAATDKGGTTSEAAPFDQLIAGSLLDALAKMQSSSMASFGSADGRRDGALSLVI